MSGVRIYCVKNKIKDMEKMWPHSLFTKLRTLAEFAAAISLVLILSVRL